MRRKAVKERFTKFVKKRMEIRGNFGVPFHQILIHVNM